jgi:DNA-binding transcriptional LysR family regulator
MDYFEAMTAFVRSAELGNFSKAAAESGAKVSTVSRYVGRLETDLGAALFNRSTRRLHLTEAGRLFYDRAKEILTNLDDACNATRSVNDHPQGLLRINTPLVFGRRHVMAHMKDFLDEYPDIRLDATMTETTVDLIEAGADVAVRIGALADSTLVARKLAPFRRILVASQDYLKKHSAPQLPHHLQNHECLLDALQPTTAWHYRQAGDAAADPVELPVQGRVRANDIESLREAALSGMGIAFLPTWLVGSDVRDQQLVEVLPDCEWLIASGPERAIWAVYPPKKVVSPKVRAFIAFISERFGEPPYWDKPSAGRRHEG